MASLITCTAITAFGLILFVWLGDRLQRSVEEWVEGLEGENAAGDEWLRGEETVRAASNGTHQHSSSVRTSERGLTNP